MTTTGLIHLASAIYLSGMLCLAISVNENQEIGRILRETARRWVKFMGACLAIGIVVYWIG
jgi:hypothetical protein